MVFRVFNLRDVVVDLMVDVVEVVPVVVDVGFPLGTVPEEKGLVGLRVLLWFPCVNPAPVKTNIFLVECLGLEEGSDVCVCSGSDLCSWRP